MGQTKKFQFPTSLKYVSIDSNYKTQPLGGGGISKGKQEVTCVAYRILGKR